MSELIQDIPRDKIRGKFNKDLLLNSFFEHTELFSPAANKFMKEGKYSGELYGSKKWSIFWDQEEERCRHGYINPVTKLWIPGKYYFHLNYTQLKIIPEEEKGKKKAKRITTFPKFWPIHYFFTQDYITASDNGLNIVTLKPRDTGFSELYASLGAHEYTFQTEDPVFYFVSTERYLNKDGVLSKCWDRLNFLNSSTERRFKHLRQYKDQDLHKRASYMDTETGVEVKSGAEIQGAVVDNPRKLRGARGFVNFEEAGSFPDLLTSWLTAVDLAQQGGVAFAMMSAWGCVCAGTKVWTNDGRLVNIEDLKQEDGIIGFNQESGQVSQEPIVHMNPPANKPCFRIVTSTGRTLECSHDHPILVCRDGEEVFIPVEGLNINDKICIAHEVKNFGVKRMFDARLVGMLIGDGTYGYDQGVSFFNCDVETLNYIKNSYETSVKSSRITKKGFLFEKLNILGIRPKLKELGILNQTSINKTLPIDIHSYSKEDICDLLGGLYDTDGSVSCRKIKGKLKIEISYVSISINIIREIQLLLQRLGIHGSIRKRLPRQNDRVIQDRNPWYEITIQSKNSLTNFHNNIFLLIKRKQDKLNLIPEIYKDVVSNNRLINKGIVTEKIISLIAIGDQPIYNLCAGKTHTYLANGIITHNTGGETGAGVAGLEELFMNPDSYDCMPFENCWEDDGILPNDHGFFFPAWSCMTKFMDKDGNTNYEKAKAYRDEERERLAKRGPSVVDKKRAEQPYNPTEALMRLQANPFPIEQLQKQLRKIDASPDINGILKHGELEVDEGKIRFKLNPKLDPVNRYPHKTDEVLEGAFTMFEAPLKDDHDKVPNSLYYIVADCFAVDTEQATDWNSLGSFYVYKKTNTMFPTEDDILVGWYHGRPPRVKDFHRRVFHAARFYNAVVQTEIKGGGQELLNYAKDHGFLEYCGERPTVFNQDKEFKKMSGRQFFVRIEENTKPERIQKLVDWLLKERNLKIEGDKTEYVLNLERIYDRGLLEELIKYNPNGNFDRISCLLVLMTIQQEAELQQVVEANKRDRDHIFNRQLFTDNSSHSQYMLSEREMKVDSRANDLIM